MSFLTVPGLMTPGQRMTAGARMPPSQVVIFEPLNGVMPPSGKVKVSAPLSVVNTTIVLSIWPISSSFFRTRPILSSICFMPASLTPQSLPPGSPTMAMYLSDSTVVMCMRAGLYQTKNGLLVCVGIVAVEEVDDLGGDFLVHGLRALQRQRTLVLAHLVRCGAVATCTRGPGAAASGRSWSWDPPHRAPRARRGSACSCRAARPSAGSGSC